MSVISSVNRLLAAHGDTMTLARDGEGTTITLKGKRLLLRANFAEIGGSAAQQEFRLKVSAVEIAASAWAVKEPKRHDTITIDGRARQVLDVRPLSDSGTVALYDMEISG